MFEKNGSTGGTTTTAGLEGCIPWADELFPLLREKLGGLSLDGRAALLARKPCENLLGLIGLTTVLFYYAERRHNPKVHDIWDALVYCSTSVSVGYGDIFAHTPAGKMLGSLLMTIGPSLAAKAIDGPPSDEPEVQKQILSNLEQILAQIVRTSPSGLNAG